jgi:hypothetical protein
VIVTAALGPSSTSDVGELTLVIVGAVVSTAIFLPPSEFGAGRARLAALLALSVIVPPLRVSALVVV